MPKKTIPNQPLTGEALLQRVRELQDASKDQKARACGYVTITKNGRERVNSLQFLNALLEAQGITLDNELKLGRGRTGRSPSFRVSVQDNGNLLVGAAYTRKMGAKPGDAFTISLGRKQIKLQKVSEDGSEDGEE